MNAPNEKPWFVRVLPDFLAFAVGLGIAYFLGWETADLVWSLWLCSLVLGYLTILSIIASMAYPILVGMRREKLKEGSGPGLLILLGLGLFFLAFFSFHFCGFHAGHSVFLRMFFPIEGMPKDGFGRAFMNPPLLWVLAFRYLMVPYGIFLIPALIAERKHIFGPLIQTIKETRNSNGDRDGDIDAAIDPDGPKRSVGEAMRRPYINVVRMHLLIFFFAFCYFLKIHSFLVYAVVYFVYFFPWRELKALKARNRTHVQARQPANIEQ